MANLWRTSEIRKRILRWIDVSVFDKVDWEIWNQTHTSSYNNLFDDGLYDEPPEYYNNIVWGIERGLRNVWRKNGKSIRKEPKAQAS
jgi:hypothetical protein